MDDDLGRNDPYRTMDSGEEGIQPDFLKKKGEAAKGVLGAAEQAASMAITAKTGKAPSGATATNKAQANEATTGGLYKAGESAGGFKNSVEASFKQSQESENKSKSEAKLSMPSGLKMAAPVLIVLVAIVGIIGVIIGMPITMIGAIDYNLQKALGFTNTVGVLEKQGEYVTAELAASGEFPSKYASDLAMNGVDVGQVTANGDFIKTNVYIADIENRNDLVAAASGFSYNSDDEGELALLFDGELIAASDFVAKVENNPKLYAAYSGAADISAKYYYSKDVEDVYKDMGLSRGSFNEWEATGDYKADEESYTKILNKILDSGSNLVVGGFHDDDKNYPTGSNILEPDVEIDDGEGTFTKDVSSGEASEITSGVAEKTKEYIVGWHLGEKVVGNVTFKIPMPDYSDNSTKRAAELLNTAVSSGEPYLASNAFMAVEEPIQRARIDGDGPVNQVMNTLSASTEVTYQNVTTGSMETKNLAILDTENFKAAVSDSKYSSDEATNFARDRVLKTTGQTDNEIIKSTTVTSNGKAKSSSVVRNGKGDSADEDVIKKANENIDLSISKKNSDLFKSVVGANRVLEGGSFLSNTINMKVIGAMPSGGAAIAEYDKVVEETIARKAEAERATLSPFDISSPNTFFGSIVHNLASALVKNYGGMGTTLTNIAAATTDVTGEAVANLTGGVSAEGVNQSFTTMSGANCATVNSVSVEGDLYCSSHNTVSTKYMNYTRSDWKNTVVGASLDEDNKIIEKSDLEQFTVMAMDRDTTVGVKSAEVCKAWHDYNDSPLEKIGNWFLDMAGLYESCSGVDEGVATGAAYTFGAASDASKNSELYSGYMLYDTVYSLLSEKKTSVAEARERYYAKHPKDNSEAGIVARRSGMTKIEAEIALAYGDYLDIIAHYDASSRYAFGKPLIVVEQPILETHSSEMEGNLYAWYQKETEYRDERNRQEMTA